MDKKLFMLNTAPVVSRAVESDSSGLIRVGENPMPRLKALLELRNQFSEDAP
jgi:hypothetical protein